MKKIALTGNIILPDEVLTGGVVLIEGETIAGVFYNDNSLPENDIEFRRYGDAWISPGLIDVHLHGALGHEVMDADVDGLKEIARHQARCGVTGFLPTTLSQSIEAVCKAVDSVKLAAALPLDSEVLGVHLEGPFVCLKRKGAQDPKYIKEVNREDLDRLYAASSGLKTLITLAPEVGNNISFIPEMVDHGFVVSMGHSDATYEEGLQAVKAGVSHATHLFNAWREFQHREPGGIGAAMDSNEVYRRAHFRRHPRPSVLPAPGDRQEGQRQDLPDHGFPGGLRSERRDLSLGRTGDRPQRAGGPSQGQRCPCRQHPPPQPGNQEHHRLDGRRRLRGREHGLLEPGQEPWAGRRIGSLAEGKLANIAVFDKDFRVIDTWLRGRPVLGGEV